MPYNFEPIPPAEEVNGSTALPLARVKRIIKLDEEIGGCSNSAAFLVTVAAEMFIHYLAKQGMKGAQKDRRKNLQYKDLANAVAALDTLEFLSDTIPRTVPYKKIVTERSKKAAAAAAGEIGQTTLNGRKLGDITNNDEDDNSRRNGDAGRDGEEDDGDGYRGGDNYDEDDGGESGNHTREESMDDGMGGTINVNGNGLGGRSTNGKRRARDDDDDEDMS